jgi:glycosyltransferase involved in cell wall biosynthesis
MINKSVSIIIPVYNDVQALITAVPEVVKYLQSHVPNYELIIAEDASTDGSYEYAKECSLGNERIIHLHRENRMGRGSALNQAAYIAKGDIFCYFDVDLATDINYLEPLLEAIVKGSDIATGSRLLSQSKITRSVDREIKSQSYNFFVRLVLGSKLHDHQCGFKSFQRDTLLSLIETIDDKHWFWDTEILIRAQRKELKISEIPVKWKEGNGTTVRTSDIFKMGYAIFKLWWQLHFSPN